MARWPEKRLPVFQLDRAPPQKRMKESVMRVPRSRRELDPDDLEEMEEWRDDCEERVPRVGAEVVDVDLTILFLLRWSEVAPARRAVPCQAASPCRLSRNAMLRLNAARVPEVSGKRLIMVVERWLSSSTDALSSKTDAFTFLCECVLSKSLLRI